MIWICHVSLQLTFLKEKPVSSKDFKLFDDLARLYQSEIDIFEGSTRIVERFQASLMIWMCHVNLQLTFLKTKSGSTKDFKLFDDLDMSCHFAIDIFEDKIRIVERFQAF